MTLATLIQKGGLRRIATATSAIPATHAPERWGSVATVATVAVASPTAPDIVLTRRWQVRYPGGDPVEVIFTPEATRAEVAAIYQGALIGPLPDSPRLPATPAEARELHELVAVILPDADVTERAYALRMALADPDAALRSFRALEADLRPDPVPCPDDKRSCEQCANLDRLRGRDGFRRCAAARRGELRIACRRDYSPVLDVPKRCEGYQPKASEADQRIGTERWPELSGGAK